MESEYLPGVRSLRANRFTGRNTAMQDFHRVVVGDMQFPSKRAAITYVRQNIYTQYESYQLLYKKHIKFMTSLLRYHPHGDQKIGVGVRTMWLQQNGGYPTRSFWLRRRDSTETDFSFLKCISPSSSLRDFKLACRKAISFSMSAFKQHYFRHKNKRLFCFVLGKRIVFNNSHVDHVPPDTFNSLVDGFIKMHNIDVKKALIHQDGGIGGRFVTMSLKEKWINYHNNHATIRVISAEANLRQAR